MSSFLDTLKERIVVFDGAMGTNLQVQNLTLEDFGGLRFEGCNENLLITRPDAVENVHTAFLDVGCDVIETNSFNGTTVDFAEYEMAAQTYDMNVRAALIFTLLTIVSCAQRENIGADRVLRDERIGWHVGREGTAVPAYRAVVAQTAAR